MIHWHRLAVSEDFHLNCQQSFTSELASNENPSSPWPLPKRQSGNDSAASLLGSRETSKHRVFTRKEGVNEKKN